MPPKKKPGTAITRFRRKVEADKRAAEEASSLHRWEWIDRRRAICGDCGLNLTLIMYQPVGITGEKRPPGGWDIKYVWGGNEYGIGGVIKEPPCCH
jgi:hypothetical protein